MLYVDNDSDSPERFGPARRQVTITITGFVNCDKGPGDRIAEIINKRASEALQDNDALEMDEFGIHIEWGKFWGEKEG